MKTLLKPGTKVRINIKEPEGYTSDLFKSIQGEIGTIQKHQSPVSLYNDAYLVKFGPKSLKKYMKTHSGKWGSSRTEMVWWTESKDFEVLEGN